LDGSYKIKAVFFFLVDKKVHQPKNVPNLLPYYCYKHFKINVKIKKVLILEGRHVNVLK
jgi:hypothetical protein